MQVEIKVKNAYGHKRNYPANDAAQWFCALCRSRCLSPGDLKLIEALGFTIIVKEQEDERTGPLF